MLDSFYFGGQSPLSSQSMDLFLLEAYGGLYLPNCQTNLDL